jgi:microcystin-dependent protein
MSQFVGEIRAFASDLPDGWTPCDGRLLKINQFVPLYSLLGAEYGGDGQTTFAVPDLRGRITAGVDASRGQPLASTSGLSKEPLESIPFAVVNWGIATVGHFPSPT